MTNNLSERLEKHTQAIREAADIKGFETAIYKAANGKTFGKLVFELVKPTFLSGGKKFIAPNFNSIKPALIADIKDAVKEMTADGMDKEEAVGYLLDPSQYDSEIGNYADTTFAEPYSDTYDGHSDLNLLMDIESDVISYLNKNIKANYKTLKV